jgi:hypothetical protein
VLGERRILLLQAIIWNPFSAYGAARMPDVIPDRHADAVCENRWVWLDADKAHVAALGHNALLGYQDSAEKR